MKKLSLVILVAVLSIAFVACGYSKDSKDSRKSQTINANDSQSESSESSAVSKSSANPQDLSAQSSKTSQSLVWELVDCDFLIKLWGITEKDCGVMDIPPVFATIEAKNIKQAYQQLLLVDDYWTLRKTKFLLRELPMKNHTHTDKVTRQGAEKYTTTYKWIDEKTLEIHIQHPDDCNRDYYTFFDLGNGRVKIMHRYLPC